MTKRGVPLGAKARQQTQWETEERWGQAQGGTGAGPGGDGGQSQWEMEERWGQAQWETGAGPGGDGGEVGADLGPCRPGSKQDCSWCTHSWCWGRCCDTGGAGFGKVSPPK